MSVTDLEQRRQALDISHSFIVQAPAGSGKTGVLTLRILKLLARVENPEDILAITFTKKAAAEMRVRVMEALELARAPTPPGDPYLDQFYEFGRQVLARDQQRQWGLQHNQNRLRLLTIDSFCSGIVRHRPLGSGLGVQFGVAEDASELYQEASAALLQSLDEADELGAALRRVLGFLDNRFARLSALVGQMLAQRDHWLEDVTRVHGDPERFRVLLEQSLQQLNQEALTQLEQAVGPQFMSELVAVTDYAREQLRQCGRDHALLASPPDPLSQHKQLLGFLLTNKGDPRKTFTVKEGFPPGQGAQKAEAARWKERALTLANQLAESPQWLALLQWFLSLPAIGLPERQWRLLQDLVLITRFAAAHLKLVFQSRRQVDFSEVALAALQTLGGDEAPSDLALLLDHRIDHILVDEFQDTSLIQVELLDRLTAGWTPGDGRTLFLVGDPMQSIYAFRKADVGLFLRLWQEQMLGQVPLQPLVLDTNFRSSAAVIQWVNTVFSRVFPSRPDARRGAVPYAQSNAHNSALAEDQVSLQLFCGTGEQMQSMAAAEGAWIAERIQALPADYSVAILVKGKSHAVDVVQALKRQGISYQAVDIESLADSQMITDLMAVLRAYQAPTDNTAWFALLRGPWCGLRLTELQNFSELHPDPWTALQSLLNETPAHCTLSPATISRLQHVARCFQQAYEQRHRQRWQVAVRDLVLQLGVPAAAANPAELEAIGLFFDLLDSIDSIADVPNFTQLQRKLRELYVPPEVMPPGQRQVQVMTMHKSKGLEFDAVFLPQLQRLPRTDDKPLILVDKQTAIAGEPQELFVAPFAPPGSSGDDDSIYQYLWGLHSHRSKNEAARLLYVACTRAKHQLHLSGGVFRAEDDSDGLKRPDGRSLLALIFDLRDHFDGTEHPLDGEAMEAPRRRFRRAADNWWQQLPSAGAPVSTSGGEVRETDPEAGAGPLYRRLAGTLTHRLLEQFQRQPGLWQSLLPEQQQPAWHRELQRMGLVEEAQLNQALAIIKRAIQRLRHSSHGHWLFGQAHEEDQAELALVCCHPEGGHEKLIIDRTFVEQGTRFIIDYKLAETEGDMAQFLEQEITLYRPQLARYRQAMQALDPRPVRAFLFFPLLDQLQEVTL